MKRTIAVFLGGVFLSLALPLLLNHFLAPDAGRLIVRMWSTPPNRPDWDELWRQWHRTNMLALYVEAPLVGLAVGAFVGLLQRRRTVLVAFACLVPDLVWTDYARTWGHSPWGIVRYVLIRSLPFIAAALAALFCQRLMRSKKHLLAADIPNAVP